MQQSNRYRSAMAAFAAICGLAVLTVGAASRAATSEVIDRSALRVCADPSNLPFSNKAGEGFENKIAELLAAELGVPVQYTWFPQATGFVRNTLKARRCDLVVGISLGFELLQNTNPYYRSAYSLVYRPDDGLAVEALDDPALKEMTIGIVAGTPPASAVAKYGLLRNVRPYQLMVDTRFDSPGKQMVEHIAAGEVDVGVLWGPIAGYYAQQQDPPLTVVPLATRPGESRMDFRITMGIRFNEPDWKHELNDLIAAKQDEINAILQDYGVPLLDEQGNLIPPVERKAEATTEEEPGQNSATWDPAVPEPEDYRMENFRAPVPETLAGATVDTTESVKALIDGDDVVLVDVLPRPPRPAALPEDTIWRPKPRRNIPGTAWLPNTGFGALSEEAEHYFQSNLERLTGGDKSRPLVIYCQADCWMSWNAAKRAVSYGYSNVHWYPEGTDGWAAAGLPVELSEPVSSAGTH